MSKFFYALFTGRKSIKVNHKKTKEVTTMEQCYICHQYAHMEKHRVFGGSNRKRSEKYNLVVDLCHKCHNEYPNGVHQNSDVRIPLQQEFRQIAM